MAASGPPLAVGRATAHHARAWFLANQSTPPHASPPQSRRPAGGRLRLIYEPPHSRLEESCVADKPSNLRVRHILRDQICPPPLPRSRPPSRSVPLRCPRSSSASCSACL